MEVRAIDHVNLHIPADGIGAAVEFYEGKLGFETENVARFESGEKPFFSFRLADACVVHVRPDDEFEPPAGTNYDHVALVLDDDVEAVKAELAAADVEIEQELTPLGATGTAPAVYVRDPFGYLVELKATT